MEIEEVSQPDSPPPPAPVPALSSQQDAILPSAVRSTSISSPVSKPVEHQAQIREKTQPTHLQLPRHWQSVAPPYRECVLDSAIQA